MHGWIDGPEGAPVVAFTHGVTMDHRSFAPQVAALAGRYRVLTWDVRGHGRSRPLGGSFSIAEAADDLIALLDRVGCEQAALVGHSMGGYVVQDLLRRHPGRASAAVMVSTTCSTWKQPLLRLGAQLTRPGIRYFPDPLLRPLLGFLGSIRPPVQAYAVEACRQVPKDDLVRIWKGITGHFHHVPGYRIPHPLVITHGAWDFGIGFGVIPALAPMWAGREPDCQYVVIPAAGHLAHQDNPAFFNAMLADFLDRRVARTPARRRATRSAAST